MAVQAHLDHIAATNPKVNAVMPLIGDYCKDQ